MRFIVFICLILLVGLWYMLNVKPPLFGDVPAHLQLKTASAGIIDNVEYTESDGTLSIKYAYKGTKINDKISQKEKKEKRFTRGYIEEGKGDTLVLRSFSGPTFYQDLEGEWFTIEHATTTKEAYQQQTRLPVWMSLLLPHTVYADTFFAGAGDGHISHHNANFNTMHDAVTGTAASAVGTTMQISTDVTRDSEIAFTDHQAFRGFLPFDTSGICSDGTVTAATLNVFVTATSDDDNDANAYITAATSTQATHTTLTTADFDQAPTPSGIALPAAQEIIDSGERKDITGISTSAYLTFTLNAVGLAAIKKDGVASTCSATAGITCIAMREGHDANRTAITQVDTTTQTNSVTISASEATGTSQDPYLDVTYSGCAAADTFVPYFPW